MKKDKTKEILKEYLCGVFIVLSGLGFFYSGKVLIALIIINKFSYGYLPIWFVTGISLGFCGNILLKLCIIWGENIKGKW